MPYFGVPIRNGLPIGLGSQAGFGIAPFDPRDLFSAGEQGAWYDPSDYSTLFTDSAGTTPVTAVEQFVGLMLDKSKGAPGALGSEVVVSPLAGTLGASYSIVGDTIVRNGSTGTAVLNPVGGVIPSTSKTYLVTFTASGVTGDSVAVRVGGGTAYGPFAGNGTFTLRVPGGGTTGAITFLPYAGGAATATYSNISVRELPGNHATSTGTKRPKLAARYNLLTYTEQFDNAAWTKVNATVTANATVAPDGTTTADKLVSAVGALHERAEQAVTIAASTAYTFTVYAKADGANFAGFRVAQDAAPSVWFDLVNGTVGTVEGGWSAAVITAAGNGWYRCKATYTTVGTSYTFRIFLSGSNGDSIFTGDGIKGLFLWGADLRPASQATGLIGPTYQRVVDAATYDTAGYLPYLSFDGIDDSMSTGSIDFTATDKMTVWAGVRKLSDANTGTVAQLSPSTSTNNGVFGLYVPFNTGASADYAWQSKGTTRITVNSPVNIGPATSVFTGVGNISAPIAQLRQNAIQVATSSASQGAGNFGNFALNIGEGAGFLNGWLTSLIVRGAQSTQSQIEATESWVNGKTGAY